jgi:hypothetical protein
MGKKEIYRVSHVASLTSIISGDKISIFSLSATFAVDDK